MSSLSSLSGLFPTLPLSAARTLTGSSAFEQALQQAARSPASPSQAKAARIQWLGAQYQKEQTLFGMLGSSDGGSESSNWNWAMRELSAPGAPYGPAAWVSDVQRVMGGLDPQVTALTQQMDQLVQKQFGTSNLLPF